MSEATDFQHHYVIRTREASRHKSANSTKSAEDKVTDNILIARQLKVVNIEPPIQKQVE